MEGSDYLQTCAEVAVALAGFAALVVAIRQRGADGIPPLVRRLVLSLIERSLVATLLALLPELLWGLGLPPRAVWAIASGALSAYVATLAWRVVTPDVRREVVGSFLSLPLFGLTYSVGIVVILLQLAHALGIGLQQSVWWYLVGVAWLLASVGYLFYFVIRGWASEA